jgi:hypothetical protein
MVSILNADIEDTRIMDGCGDVMPLPDFCQIRKFCSKLEIVDTDSEDTDGYRNELLNDSCFGSKLWAEQDVIE